MKYSEFYSMIFPVINARGNSMLYSRESIMNIVNIWIQQIYNEYRWSFLFDTVEVLKWNITPFSWYFKYNLIERIKQPLQLSYLDWNTYIPLNPAKSLLDFNEQTFLAYGKELFMKEKKDYLFTYYKQYTFKDYLTNMGVELPIPDNFIPALYYLVLSQIDMIYVQQLDWQPSSNFNKYQYEIDKLKKDDLQPATSFIWVNYK